MLAPKVMMLKCLILQSLYNLSDEELEFLILDCLSFACLLGIDIGKKVPDVTTIWNFQEDLASADIVEGLFNKFGL